MKRPLHKNGIPISPSLDYLNQPTNGTKKGYLQKKRLLQISLLSIGVAIAISLIAKVLISLIDLVTNIAFYGSFDLKFNSPANNHLGLWVIIIPAIGGVLVGLMALYGSKAIRGHGIPEAMEQILVNQSKIKPSIALLKPLSSAIAIGTGGPFGAEGPIIATGGALGSTLGQLFKITPNERKIILAAGATAGMSAIFGTPIAAIFLAIELLLFEFSPKAILPVALACITGAAGHQFLFESGPVFHMPELSTPTNMALGIYSFMGIIIGFISLGLTKIVYHIEDAFEKLPIHWMWWPAIGGLAVGVIGYFAPHTLGVGYDNIISVLSGKIPLALLLSLCFFKFLSWAIALGSGTSGGTLAPLLTIGGAAGAILGSITLLLFPNSGISIPMAALVGMSAMFAGASRAYLTSITFALEATMQSHALLPLLGACTASYLISFFFMENTIMTEKIARRGIYTPDSYEPDILRKMTVADVLKANSMVVSTKNRINEIRAFFDLNPPLENHFMVMDEEDNFKGVITLSSIYNKNHDADGPISEIMEQSIPAIKSNDNLATAVELMSKCDEEFLPVLSTKEKNRVIGLLTYKDVLTAYKIHLKENQEAGINLSLKRQRIKILVKGRQLIHKVKEN
ncbi:chloride channel protein [Pedobacter foliorum]|uniref:chloride channel protein n=1 Tax=Pedobacter foliorum TaxID=2739058 RepID=UPI0015677459|nr:chloride channel protein [Pedobacter foliorum]NRF41505.1 chloride channel protein [Pedobacter foliorum]